MSAVLTWLDIEAISKNPEIVSRNLFARTNHAHEPSKIVENYNYLTLDELRRFVEYIFKDLGLVLSGVGVDLGAGVSGVSNSLLSIYPAIEKIYAVEIVPDVVTMLQKKVTQHLGNEDRLISVIGSFDDIRVPDNSVDFIVEYDSLHHSFDLDKTLREAARILKPGGILIAMDRVQANWLTDAQREFMLSAEYSEAFKIEYGLPIDTKLTRGENGEHEIRESEWRSSFKQAGLEVGQQIMYHRKGRRGFAFAVISQIPYSLRSKYRFYPMLVRLPLSLIWMYLLPFIPALWNKRFRELKLHLRRREAGISKTVFVVSKPR